ncbi:hypothetical protein Taro_025064 [Colocasia esculenta]|uniref:Uncharacterized protein n=1 Tax=Colocasia esculenta TaxID=4460 RepID=A0A843V8F8_COLES|nr:hypothetical protein [Colocasia esculenta]
MGTGDLPLMVYAKLETAKTKIREVFPRYAHLVLDVVEDRWDWQMSRDLHMAIWNRLSHRRLDNLVYVHYNMRLRVKHLTEDPKQRLEVNYDHVDIGFLRDDEDPMVALVARATTEQGKYKLDEEPDDPKDPPRPNTLLARAVKATAAAAKEDGDRGHKNDEAKIQVAHVRDYPN